MANYRRKIDDYRPQTTFTQALILLKPTYTTVGGVKKKTYQSIEEGTLFYGSFKTYGGTETTVNGVYSVEDTAEIQTWFMPDVTGDCAIAIAGTTARYEILGEPENISMRNQFIKMKVKRIKGGA